MEVPNATYYDFYRLIGGKNLENETSRTKVEEKPLYFILNEKQWYFEDVKCYNSFVRIRNEHLKSQGAISRVVELDFYDVRSKNTFIMCI